MKRTYLNFLMAVLISFSLLAGAYRLGQAGRLADPESPVSQGFTYQGQLDNNGSPFNGSCDFTFTMWNAATNGSPVGDSETKPGTPVTNGVFSVQLNESGQFGASAFNGSQRWLDIAVKCGSDLNPTDLGRQLLDTAPYASYALKAGSVTNGVVTTDSYSDPGWITSLSASKLSGVLPIAKGGTGSGTKNFVDLSSAQAVAGAKTFSSAPSFSQASGAPFSVASSSLVANLNADLLDGQQGAFYQDASNLNTGTLGNDYFSAYSDLAAEGYLDLSGGTDLLTLDQGDARYSTAGHNHWGASWSGPGNGLSLSSSSGKGLDATGASIGVSGRANSTSGEGVYGYASAVSGVTYGVYGQSDSVSGRGVYGNATATSGYTYGVYGESDSVQGKGLWGTANATSGTTYGVYGKSQSTGGRGVFGEADAVSGSTYGVKGASASTSGTGVFGEATSVRGTTYGVNGQSHSPDGFGGYFYNNGLNGVSLKAQSSSGNIIEGYGSSSTNRRFFVSNTGDVYADGTYYGAGGVNAGSADYAEMVHPGLSDLLPGEVLVVDIDGKVVRSTQANQSNVIGVYSTQPGFIAGKRLDENGNPLDPEMIPLAVFGIVPVKVSAENGAIKAGDLLSASNTPGHAMKASPITINGITFYPSGVVIGKALEGLTNGTGVIQVLVTLQ